MHKLGLPGCAAHPRVGALLLESDPGRPWAWPILENAANRHARIVAVEPEEYSRWSPASGRSPNLMAGCPSSRSTCSWWASSARTTAAPGLDPNVIGRQRVETMPDLPTPVVTRLAVLDLSAETRGNALGIGLADLTTERVVRGIDPTPMRREQLHQ